MANRQPPETRASCRSSRPPPATTGNAAQAHSRSAVGSSHASTEHGSPGWRESVGRKHASASILPLAAACVVSATCEPTRQSRVRSGSTQPHNGAVLHCAPCRCRPLLLCVLLVLAPPGGRRGKRVKRHDTRNDSPNNRRAPRRFFFRPGTEGNPIDERQGQPSTEGWHAEHPRSTSQTDDQRIEDVTPLPPPEHLIRFFPIARHAGRDADRRHARAHPARSCTARTTACWWSSGRARSTTRPPRSSTRGG